MPRRRITDAVIVLGVAAAFALLPGLYSNQVLLFDGMMYLVLALGVNVLYGFTGYLPFGYVGFYGAGVYAASVGILLLHLPPALAVVGGAVVSMALALLLSPLLRLSGAYFAIASLAASQAIYLVVSNPALQTLTGGPYGVNLPVTSFDPTGSYLTMCAITALGLAVVLHLRRSSLGMELEALRDDPSSAGMAGVHVVQRRVLAWLVSAALAGLVGGAWAWFTSTFYADQVFALNVSIFAIVFTLFGGTGTLLGPLVGTVLLYGMYNVIGLSDPEYFQLIYGLLILLLVLFLPQGLASLARRWKIHVL